jgi:hypothetical protein
MFPIRPISASGEADSPSAPEAAIPKRTGAGIRGFALFASPDRSAGF